MKSFRAILLILLVLVIGYLAFSSNKKSDQTQDVASIEGCYVAGNSKDVYTMNVQSQTGENVSGTLNFDNYEKDSSSGTFVGTYSDGILLGDYSFNSEGSQSEMEVIFKNEGEDFIRGYGDVNTDGTKFVDITNISYESNELSLFKKTQCN